MDSSSSENKENLLAVTNKSVIDITKVKNRNLKKIGENKTEFSNNKKEIFFCRRCKINNSQPPYRNSRPRNACPSISL